jgi:hypothetical protein
LVIASRSSATFLPEKSSGVRAEAADAADAAVWPALRAPFAAVCCRPRALPPAFAARLRAGVLADELAVDRRLLDELLELVDFRADAPDPERALDLRAVDPEPRELAAGLRAAGLRVVEADDFRVDDPLERRREDDPPPLPLFDSAMLSSSEAFSTAPTTGSHYVMPRAAVTCA